MNLSQAAAGFGGNLRQGQVPLLDPSAFRGPTIRDINEAGEGLLNVAKRAVTAKDEIILARKAAQIEREKAEIARQAQIKNKAILEDIADLSIQGEQGKKIADIAKNKLDAQQAASDATLVDLKRDREAAATQVDTMRAQETLAVPGATQAAIEQQKAGAEAAKRTIIDNAKIKEMTLPLRQEIVRKVTENGGSYSVTKDGQVTTYTLGDDGLVAQSGTTKAVPNTANIKRQTVKAQIPGAPAGTMGLYYVDTGEPVTDSSGKPLGVQTPKQTKEQAAAIASIVDFDQTANTEKLRRFATVIEGLDKNPAMTTSKTVGEALDTVVLGDMVKALFPNISTDRMTLEGLSAELGIEATSKLKGSISNNDMKLALASTLSPNLPAPEIKKRLQNWAGIYARAAERNAEINKLMKYGNDGKSLSFDEATSLYNSEKSVEDQIATSDSTLEANKEYLAKMGVGEPTKTNVTTQKAGQPTTVRIKYKSE